MPDYYATFGTDHQDRNGKSLGNAVVIVEADSYSDARDAVFEARGPKWAFLYTKRENGGNRQVRPAGDDAGTGRPGKS